MQALSLTSLLSLGPEAKNTDYNFQCNKAHQRSYCAVLHVCHVDRTIAVKFFIATVCRLQSYLTLYVFGVWVLPKKL